MIIPTSRFGDVEVSPDRILNFRKGLFGFSYYTDYTLINNKCEDVFHWLQSIKNPDLAFVVTSPRLWVPDYEIKLAKDQLQELGLIRQEDAQILSIINKYCSKVTTNLQGPLIINQRNRKGVQIVLADRRWSIRHEIASLEGITERR